MELYLLTAAFVVMALIAIWSIRHHLKADPRPIPTDGAENPLSLARLQGIPDLSAVMGAAARRNLRDGFAELLRPLSEPGLRISQSLRPTISHFGGLPPSQPAFTWPHRGGRPLTLLARLDLAEVPPVIEWLPRVGTLLFFYDNSGQPTGADPIEREGWSVIFCSPANDDHGGRREPPNGASPSLDQVAIKFEEIPTLPPADNEKMRALDLTPDERQEIAEFFGGAHQIGGHPATLKSGFMEFECQLGLQGVSRHDLSGPDDPRARQLMTGVPEWRLLLQMNSDERVGTRFGNSGTLYFWIREQDARRGDFSKVWCVLESH